MTRMFYVIILALLTAGEARSQSAELGLTVGVSAFNDNGIGSLRVFEEGLIPSSLRNGVRIGARWATNSWGFLGHEFSYAFQRTSLKIGDGPSDGIKGSAQNRASLYAKPFASHETAVELVLAVEEDVVPHPIGLIWDSNSKLRSSASEPASLKTRSISRICQ